MEAEWKSQKEKEKAREKEIVVCEEKAAEEQKEIRRLEIIESGKVNDYQRVLQNARKEVLQEKALVSERTKLEQACWNVKCSRMLAEEVSRLKNEGIKESKRRQLPRSTSVELGQLEEHLRSANAGKAVKIQLKDEQEANRRNTRCKELQQDKMIKGCLSNNNSEQENLVVIREKKERYRKDLQDQLIMNYRKRQEKSEEKQRERKMSEEVSRLLRIEEMEKYRQKKVMAAEEQEAFRRAKEIWLCKEKKALLDEHNRIELIITEKENEKRRSADDAKSENLAAKERIGQKNFG